MVTLLPLTIPSVAPDGLAGTSAATDGVAGESADTATTAGSPATTQGVQTCI